MAKSRPEPEKSVDTEEESGEEEESGQEEEEASSDENGGSDSEPEPPLTQVSRTLVTKKPSASAPRKPEPSSQSKRASSSEESDSESDSNPNVKPIASKPMDDSKPPSAAATPTKKPRSKPAASPTKSAAAGTKRPAAAAADGEAKEPKKSKKKPNAEVESSVKKSMTEDSKKKPTIEVESSAKKSLSEDPKKQLFQRLWSEEDEISVLKGMIAYAEEKNADPVADLNAFHDFIRESLHLDATRTQLQDKIRRLKKKYENNARKEKKGKERTFSKAHEQNAYDLSKKIWGGHKAQNGSVVKAAESSKASNASARKERIKNAVIPVKGSTVAAAEVDHVLVEEKEANTNMDVDINVEGSKSLNLSGRSLFGKSLNELAEWIEKNKVGLSEEKLIEMEGKWKALKVAELELFLKKAALIQEQGRLVLDALK